MLKFPSESRLDLSPPGFRTIDLWYPRKFPDPPQDVITDSDRSWFFYLAEIALRRLANRIMASNSRNLDLKDPSQAIVASENAAEFEQEAQDWLVLSLHVSRTEHNSNKFLSLKDQLTTINKRARKVLGRCPQFHSQGPSCELL